MRSTHRQHENERSTNLENHTKGRDFAFLIAGIGIGSGIALLLAPASGEDVRYRIGRRYRRAMRAINRTTDGVRDRAQDLFERAHDLRESSSRLFHFGRGESTRRKRAA